MNVTKSSLGRHIEAMRPNHHVGGKDLREDEIPRDHRKLKVPLLLYVLRCRPAVLLTVPIIYLGILPFSLLDLFLTAYQAVCFPIFGIPKVRRADHFVYDRGRLAYLNLLEKLNCVYCSYANGLCAYATEIAARTEQHWCPVKHASKLQDPHSRYWSFIDYGDAEAYRREVSTRRRDFADLNRRR
jgi:hypothetical protein